MTAAGFQRDVIPTPAGLAESSQALSDWLTAQGAPEAGIGRVELVLEEVVMNVIMHGAPAVGAPLIQLAAAALPEGCQLTILDNGPPFDPTTAAPRADGASLDQAAPGGLGLVLLRRYARELRYHRLPGGNRLTLTIPYAPQPAGAPLPTPGTLR
jgi:serine/threonine-protein kinase RsbW